MMVPGDPWGEDEELEPPQALGPELVAASDATRMARGRSGAHRRSPHNCRSCGRSLGPGTGFCMNCGAVSEFYDPDLTTQVAYRRAPSAGPPAPQSAYGLSHSRRRWRLVAVAVVVVAIALLVIYLMH